MNQNKRFDVREFLQAELSDLCRRDNVNLACGPRELPGSLVSLYLMPVSDDDTRQSGLEVQIVPLAPLADLEDGIFQSMREAAEESLTDSNPDVRDEAADALKRMALPRLAPNDIAGHLFSLSPVKTRGPSMSEATDRHGKARFERLASQCEFQLEYGGRDVNGVTGKTDRQIKVDETNGDANPY